MANDSNNNNNSNDLATRASTKHRQVEDQAALVRKLKAEGTHDKSSVTAEVDILKSLKAELVALEAELHAQQARDGATRAEKKFDRTALEELLRKRFYYVQSFGIYGGVTGLYDYGPAGMFV